ncbi:MAG TPA: CHASE domain-containing protein [Chromatiaceae bacterium]|nr:CHASE domain-containing protein [Chromatiaceae bacterium]
MFRLLKLHWLAILVGVTGVLLSTGAFWVVQVEIEKRHQLEFEWLAQNRNRVLKKGIEEGLNAVRSLHDLLLVAPQVDEQAFDRFAHGLADRFKGIQALAWVTPQAGPAEEDRFPIRFFAAEGNSALHAGQDLGAQPLLRNLMDRALARGDMVVSGRILLIHDPNPQYGFMAFKPVYAAPPAEALAETPPEGQGGEPLARLRGFAVGVFRIADIADAAMGVLEPRGVEFLVLDESAPAGEELLDFYASRLNHFPTPATTEWRGWDLEPAPRVTESFPVADRRWSITCSPTRQFTTEVFREGPWIILGSGLALTLVVVLFIAHFRAALRLRLRIEEELRASEQKLRILIDQSPDIIMTVDRVGRVLIVNRPLATGEGAGGRCGAGFLPIRARERFNQALAKVLSLGEPEHFGYAGDDSTWWELRLVPLREGDRVAAAMVILTDVTEKRVLEAHAIRNARLASLGVIAASVAHEINNPNNAIQFNASILARSWEDLRKVLDQHRRDYGDFTIGGVPVDRALTGLPRLVEGIVKGAQRIEKIVGNLKHMARPDAGDLDHAVDLGEVLPMAMSILQSQIHRYTDHCRLELPEALPYVRGNAQQLEQVFINLILNALQALPERAAAVLISAGLEPEGEFVRVCVADEGRGMAEEVRERVTEPFFTTRGTTGGTGLGLSICARIIQHHSGRMEIDSAPGAGTRVSVLLPLAKAGEQS